MTNCRVNCHLVGGGYCERHGIRKGKHWIYLCQTRDDYFQAWEEGRGPGQLSAKAMGQPAKIKREQYNSNIGNILGRRFESIGIKPIKGCPCKDLQSKLNTMSPASVLSDVEGWATRLHNSARKWQELKGGVWNMIPTPPLWLCKRVLLDAVREAQGYIGEDVVTSREE